MALKQLNPYKLAFAIAALALTIALVMVAGHHAPKTGPLFIICLVALALGVRGFPSVKGFSYTISIFTAVTASMFYPECFKSIGDFQLKTLIVPLLQIIMFGMGSQMSFQDFTGVIKMPKGVIIGVTAHYLIMPLVGFGIANLFDFPPEIKAGIILIGCVPSGLASNVMSYIAGANLPLAVTIGAISTLLSPLFTPLLMKELGGKYIPVNFWKMVMDILNMIILPVVAGFIFNLFSAGKVNLRAKFGQLTAYALIILLANVIFLLALDTTLAGFALAFAQAMFWFYVLPIVGAISLRYFLKGNPHWLERILALISMVGIAVIITIITATGRDSLLQVGALLMLTSLLHNVAGYSLGYSISWLTGMPEKDRRTVAFEVGMQNGGLASALAVNMGKAATVGLAPAIFGPLMNVTGSILASWWRSRPVLVENEIDGTIPATEMIES